MPRPTIVELTPAEQAQMLAEIRRARYGDLLAVHILLLCAAQRRPTEIAAVLFCSRSSVYRVVQAYRVGQWENGAEEEGFGGKGLWQRTGRSPALKRSGIGMLKSAPRLCGWWRTRWRCATVALELFGRRRITVSGETVRRWRQE